VTWLLIVPTSVTTGCGLIGWLAWLFFNAWVFKRTGDLQAFEKTAAVARSFRRPPRPGAEVPTGNDPSASRGDASQ
jgi:hypothetical protein